LSASAESVKPEHFPFRLTKLPNPRVKGVSPAPCPFQLAIQIGCLQPRTVFAVLRREVGHLMIVGPGDAGVGKAYFGVSDQFGGFPSPATPPWKHSVARSESLAFSRASSSFPDHECDSPC
jgi:hypothetical protein